MNDYMWSMHRRTETGNRGKCRALLIFKSGNLHAFGPEGQDYKENWERMGQTTFNGDFVEFVAGGRGSDYNVITFLPLDQSGTKEAMGVAEELDVDIRDALIS